MCTTNSKREKAAKNLDITVFMAVFSFVNCQSRDLLSQKFKVIAYDIDEERVSQLKVDNALFTCCESDMKKAAIYIITVPTPINQ